MSPLATYVAIAVLAYLLGSIPFGYVLVRIFKGSDIRQSGSGNIGATNVARSGSKVLGLATLILDAVKGGLAVGLAVWFFAKSFLGLPYDPTQAYSLAAFAAVCAIVGHMFPVWLRFHGGKGVATAAGAFLLLAPRATLVSLAVFIAVATMTRFVSLGSVLSVAVFPAAAWFFGPDRSLVFMALVTVATLLIIVKHHTNIRRLLTGKEDKFVKMPPQMEKHT